MHTDRQTHYLVIQRKALRLCGLFGIPLDNVGLVNTDGHDCCHEGYWKQTGDGLYWVDGGICCDILQELTHARVVMAVVGSLRAHPTRGDSTYTCTRTAPVHPSRSRV